MSIHTAPARFARAAHGPCRTLNCPSRLFDRIGMYHLLCHAAAVVWLRVPRRGYNHLPPCFCRAYLVLNEGSTKDSPPSISRTTVQQRIVPSANRSPTQCWADMHRPLGQGGARPALLGDAVKRKLNGIAVDRDPRWLANLLSDACITTAPIVSFDRFVPPLLLASK